jgi:CRP/FNR family cyclic AMP-dependent transcriptional regulator
MVNPGGETVGPVGRTLRDIIGKDVWSKLLRQAVERHHSSGTVLLRQGEPGTHVVAVLSGVTKVVRHESSGTLTLLAFRGPGELLGEVAVLDQGVRSASVETISPCDIAVLSRAEFLRFANEYDLFRSLVQYALTRLRESDEARGSAGPVTRLAATLVTLADTSKDSGMRAGEPLEFALTRDDLAQHLKVSRNTVTAALGKLAGHVDVRRKCVVVNDVPGLRRVATENSSGDL